jgi:hypothetical protein
VAYFDKKWAKMLRREGVKVFHSKKLRDTDCDFAGWSRERKAGLISKAGDVVKVAMFGLSTMVRQSEYDEFFKGGARPRKVPLDSMYGLCFRYCAMFVSQVVQRSLEGRDIRINFILESGHKNAGDAERVFHDLKRDEPYSSIFKSIAFGAKGDFYGLQGADMVSHTAFLAEQGEPKLTEFPADGTVQIAKDLLKRKGPIFRCHLHPDELVRMKSLFLAADERRFRFGQRQIIQTHEPVAAE